MTVTTQALARLDEHWAVKALGSAARDRAFDIARHRLVRQSIGNQFQITYLERSTDSGLLERAATAYEIAAIEGMDSLLYPTPTAFDPASDEMRQQAQAGAFRAFELLRHAAVPSEPGMRIFHILHSAALAYAGERWIDLRRWFTEETGILEIPSTAEAEWDQRILYRLFDCWIRLFRKNRWDDLDGIHDIIARLREDQKEYESGLLTAASRDLRAIALRLIALYHWAKATELLAVYVIQGTPRGVATALDQHFEAASQSARAATDVTLDTVLKWLHVAARRMVAGSIWSVAHSVNSRVSQFVDLVTKTKCMFELLPPQQSALHDQGLLDQATKAVVVNLPTSGGKTILAQFRILQALNQFDGENGWVAYVAPTRALVSQITRRLRRDFEPLGVRVEHLTSAVEVDAYEDAILEDSDHKAFDVLIATPEKLNLVIRNRKVPRPLALIVLDEAQNIEDSDRGLRIELLLATIKRDCPEAAFLLLMPDVPNAKDLARWLAPEGGKAISIGSSAWTPNDRIVGLFGIRKSPSRRGDWSLHFDSLITTPKAFPLKGNFRVGGQRPLNISYSRAKSLSAQAGAMATVLSQRGTSIAVTRTIADAWSTARLVAACADELAPCPVEIQLVQRFLRTEISPQFELVDMLSRGVAVHHAGLSDESRSLVEWLAEEGLLRVLCATTTIAQGLNFPVSSVFLSSLSVAGRYGNWMSQRAFWNLAGRAGRIDHDSVGVVGIAAGTSPDSVRAYVSEATGALISRLVAMLSTLQDVSPEGFDLVIQGEEWTDFRIYIAHLWSEKRDLDALLAETEQVLRNTFGYRTLQGSGDGQSRKTASALLEATRRYAIKLSEHPENMSLADSTGFSPEGVRAALLGLGELDRRLSRPDWEPRNLFGDTPALSQIIGVMLNVPQIRESLTEIAGGAGIDRRRIADLAKAWVGGTSIEAIAKEFFGRDEADLTICITRACKGIYRTLTGAGTWGLAALSKMPTAGLDVSTMSAEQLRVVNALPAMLYHGVNSEAAVLMRMNSVPRTIATALGELYAASGSLGIAERRTSAARDFLRSLDSTAWDNAVPPEAAMTGADYRAVWLRLSGESVSDASREQDVGRPRSDA